jgi:chromosome segregation ATPase
MTPGNEGQRSDPDPSQALTEARLLEQEVARLREVLETEREAATRDMAAGAAELAQLDARVANQRKRIDQLQTKVQRIRDRAAKRRRRIAELEAELARYRSSRAARIAVRLGSRRRTKKGGT